MTEKMLKDFIVNWMNKNAVGTNSWDTRLIMVAFNLDVLVVDLEQFIKQDQPR
jgi:hypothetical protein